MNNLESSAEAIRDLINKYQVQTVSFDDEVDGDLYALQSGNWECIDGRLKESGKLRYPGGSAGLLITLLSTLKKLGVLDQIHHGTIIDEFTTIMGPARYHTDTHSNGNEDLACWGCGHLRLAYQNQDDYNIEEGWLMYMAAKDRFQKDVENGVCVVLDGEHNEQAVVVDTRADKVITPPSLIDSEGKSISFFVYHPSVAQKTLEMSALKIKDALNINIDANMLLQALKETQSRHFQNTGNELARGLPIIQL